MTYAVIGSRDYRNYEQFRATLDGYTDITRIVSGGARGPDGMAERYARDKGIPCDVFAADWANLGKAAGIIRNTDIINAAEAVIAFWDGKSTGTKDSLKKAIKQNKPVNVHLTTGKTDLN